MATRSGSSFLHAPSLSAVLLGILFAALWLAGGASRADVEGQTIVRVAASSVLVIAALFADRPVLASVRPVMLFLLATSVIAAVQLVPLPPSLWMALSEYGLLEDTAGLTGGLQQWRPWSIVPGATVNAFVSLIVPAATVFLMAGLRDDERRWLPGMLLCMVGMSVLVGLLQFSGTGFHVPFVNSTPGQVSGTFANRNHFALFLALGCLLVPVWMFREGRRVRWRGPVGIGLLLLFALTILATGSRAGIALGVLAIALGGVIARHGLRKELRHAPRWALSAVVVAVVALIASFVLISVAANRAVSIQRSLSVDVEQDMRSRALPTIWEMIRATFPVGNGLGSFDPMFRLHEPLALVKPTYLNQAHNDFMGVVLDAGLPGLLLLGAALAWWAWASIRAWRGTVGYRSMLPRVGSAMLLLVVVASVFDYPGRTPLIMAMMVLAAMWLSSRSDEGGASALPGSSQHL